MADENRGEGGESSVNVSLGKEIDRSLAEIISALLKPAATEVGNLLGDSIGFVSDQIRNKRENNARIGLSEVRRNLEENNIKMKDVTPPQEEELHLLMNGMSLSGDEVVRKFWAGIFAKALDPNSGETAERPFLAVLGSLSLLDAKIIDFLAFAFRTDSELRKLGQRFMPKDFKNITPEEKETIERIQVENSNHREKAVSEIADKAKSYGLDALDKGGWADNLLRLGVIERTPISQPHTGSLHVRSLDERGILQVFEHLNEQVEFVKEATIRKSTPPSRLLAKDAFGSQIQLEIRFTEFEDRLATACGLL